MFLKLFKYTLIALFLFNFSNAQFKSNEILTGAQQPDIYLPLLKNKRVGVVTNQTGVTDGPKIIGKKDCNEQTSMETCAIFEQISIVDFLLDKGIEVKKIFSPEHGFRGNVDAGATVKSGKDTKTGLPIISLYGKNKKPTKEQYADLDVIVFDIQDVGVRFYTYISTLHYIMEAAAENDKKVIVFDRPNPNAHYVDGPVLKEKHKTFVGMHPVPVVYGMTMGEYALMINGEKWLENDVECDLEVIPLRNYTHQMKYSLPIKPSPNLPNDHSINLYPSTCFFEAFNGSEGRGTDKPFQIYGSPYLKNMSFEFTPQPNAGASNPRFKGEICYGEDLSEVDFLSEIKLEWLIKARKNYVGKNEFWIKQSGAYWIDKLAGTEELRKQIDAGWTEEEIKSTWTEDLNKFSKVRAKYLMYD